MSSIHLSTSGNSSIECSSENSGSGPFSHLLFDPKEGCPTLAGRSARGSMLSAGISDYGSSG